MVTDVRRQEESESEIMIIGVRFTCNVISHELEFIHFAEQSSRKFFFHLHVIGVNSFNLNILQCSQEGLPDEKAIIYCQDWKQIVITFFSKLDSRIFLFCARLIAKVQSDSCFGK